MQRIICVENSGFLSSIYETLAKKFLEQECFIYETLEEAITQIPLVEPHLLIIDFDTIVGRIDRLIDIIPTNTKVIITSRSSTENILSYENWVKPIAVEKIQNRFFEILGVSEKFTSIA